MVQAHGSEQPRMGDEHLGPAQKEVTGAFKGKMQPVHDPALGLGVEIHQGVAADQQVQPGYGCVLDEVMAAKDHRLAQVGAENSAAVGVSEVPLQELLWDSLELSGV